MMGVPIDGPTYLLGDNASMVLSGTIPQSTLTKRHNALAYHRVREAVAAKIMYFLHIGGKENPADLLTKFLPHATFWPFVRSLLFWRGETTEAKPTPSMRGVTGSHSRRNDSVPSGIPPGDVIEGLKTIESSLG